MAVSINLTTFHYIFLSFSVWIYGYILGSNCSRTPLGVSKSYTKESRAMCGHEYILFVFVSWRWGVI